MGTVSFESAILSGANGRVERDLGGWAEPAFSIQHRVSISSGTETDPPHSIGSVRVANGPLSDIIEGRIACSGQRPLFVESRNDDADQGPDCTWKVLFRNQSMGARRSSPSVAAAETGSTIATIKAKNLIFLRYDCQLRAKSFIAGGGSFQDIGYSGR